jgi:predicted nucleic acid-binding protein
MLVLDSTVLIDYLRGRPAADRINALVDTGRDLATTGINVEEIVRGLRPDEAEAARALFAGLLVLSIDAEAGLTAGAWRREAAARGRTRTQADSLIAAAVFLAGARRPPGIQQTSPVRRCRWSIGWSESKRALA